MQRHAANWHWCLSMEGKVSRRVLARVDMCRDQQHKTSLGSYKRRVYLTSVGENNTHHPSVDAVSTNYTSAAKIHISGCQFPCRRCVLVSKSRKLKCQERPRMLGFHVLFIAFYRVF